MKRLNSFDQSIRDPPLTFNDLPVIFLADSDDKNAATLPISSGVVSIFELENIRNLVLLGANDSLLQ